MYCDGVSLSAWYRHWILLGGLQARVRDLFSPATAFGLQYRRCGSCHTPVLTWWPSIPGRRSSSVERATAQCHLRTIFVLIPATPEDNSSDNGVNNTNYCVVVLKCLALSTTLSLANWTELNTWLGHHFQGQKVKGQLAGGGSILWRPPAQLVICCVRQWQKNYKKASSLYWSIDKRRKQNTIC